MKNGPEILNILLIEDNPGDMRLIEEMLSEARMLPCELEYAPSLAGGLALLRNKTFNAVLLDIELPDCNGLDSIMEIRNLAPGAPIVMLTGLDDEGAAISSLKLGAQDYLVKGRFETDTLVRSIRYAIERKKAAQALEEKQHFMQRITDTTPNILYLFDLSEHNLVYANRELKNTLGHTREELQLLGKDLYEKLIHPEDLPYLNDKIHTISEASDDSVVEIELRFKHADGTWRWIRGRNVVFSRDRDGRTIEILGAASDVTDQKKVEAELLKHREYLMELVEERTEELQKSYDSLQRAHELLENVFSNVHILIAYMDKDFNFIRVNSKYAEADGKDHKFYVGKNHFALFPNEENEAIFLNVVKTGEPYYVHAKPFKYAHNPERGTTFWDWSLKPVIDAYGKVTGLVLSLIDVTDNIILYGELIRADHLASIGKLAAGVAHEINNPINGIINYAQILVNKSITGSRERDIAGRIIKESDRIAGIVSSLLSFARDSKGEKAPVHVSEVLEDSLALTEAQMKKHGIKMKIDIPGDLPRIFANKQQIEQVFLNVIGNADYALNEKHPHDNANKVLEIRGEEIRVDGNSLIRMTFSDTGTGIPSEIRDKVMNPFFSTKPGNSGTGLGLSISHGIISDHGGNIRIDSKAGEFTKVIIDLPVRQAK